MGPCQLQRLGCWQTCPCWTRWAGLPGYLLHMRGALLSIGVAGSLTFWLADFSAAVMLCLCHPTPPRPEASRPYQQSICQKLCLP